MHRMTTLVGLVASTALTAGLSAGLRVPPLDRHPD